MLSKGLNIAVSLLIMLVFSASVVQAGQTGAAEQPDSEAPIDGSRVDTEDPGECDELYELGEWTETQFTELLDCLFDLRN